MFPGMIKNEREESTSHECAEQKKILEQKQRAELRERFLRFMSFLGGKQVCLFHFRNTNAK